MRILKIIYIRLKLYINEIVPYIKWRKICTYKFFKVTFAKDVTLHAENSGHLTFWGAAHISARTDIVALDGSKIEIGNNFYVNRNSTIVSRYGISIGNNCMFGESVFIYDHDHEHIVGNKPFKHQGFIGAPISIGNNVWIGSHVFIGKGVNIGDNVVIGAGSVVIKSIPANSLARSTSRIQITSL
jgi:acetyltransferase-like isoleucine patch superfamily enzyme